MKIKNILVSQPKPVVMDKSPFKELIDNQKVAVDFVPFIKIEPTTAKEFRAQRVEISAYSAVIFSSRGNIDNFFKVCEENRIHVSDEMKYFCTTETIALYLQKYIVYRKRKIFFGKGSFADLMATIIKHKEEKFLLAVTEPHKIEIEKGLEKAKIKFEKIVLAHTVSAQIKEVVKPEEYNMMVFYSRQEIKSLVENFGENLDSSIKIATFGTATASAAVEAGFKVSVLAPTAKFPSMAMAIKDYITKSENGEEVDTKYIAEAIKEAAAIKEQVLAKVKPVKKKSVAKSSTTTLKVKKSSCCTDSKKVATAKQ